jgi:large repetitive protein
MQTHTVEQETLLPAGAAIHLRGASGRALVASYIIGTGAVVVDTITKEYAWGSRHQTGWTSDVMVAANLVRFALGFVPGPPAVTVPADVLALEAVSAAGTAYQFTATSTSAVTCDPVSGSVFELGSTTVTCSATNSYGDSTAKSFTITVVDTTAPVITAPTAVITQQGNTAGGATVTYSVSASDAVEGTVPVVCDKPSDTFLFPLGTSTVTCTAKDSGNHETTASFDVEVIDTNGPSVCMVATAPVTQEGNTTGGAVFTYTATSTDVVEGDVTATCSHASGSVFPVGTTTVTCSASDSGHHETVASFDVVVTDTSGPVITVPAAAVTQEANAAGGATVSYTVSANDAVEGTKTVTCDKLSGTHLFPLGTSTVTCTAKDSGDIETTESFSVVVTDTTSPVVTMVATASLTLESNSTTGGAVFTYNVTAVDTVTCSASDRSNNAAAASLTVVVTAAPTPAPTDAKSVTSGSAFVAFTWQAYLLVLMISAVLYRAV